METPAQLDKLPSPPGAYFGDYFLIGVLGRGGMGEVWLARHESLNRRVALKWIQAEHSDSVRRQRFRLEAEAAAKLSHENIVRVFDVGEVDGRPYIAMEYMEGGSLEETILVSHGKDGVTISGSERERQEANASLIVTICRAVHYAHQHGVLHRDLKPGNILLDGAGVPHVADFGLAKLARSDGEFEHLSLTGQVLGSPGYMSPEQASGKSRDLTIATDVFSLGAILYRLLTGRVPFEGGTLLESLQAVREREPTRPTGLNSAIDPDLETICLKCLEKEPGRRYGSAEAFAEDLERWMRREPILARPVTTFERVIKWARRRPAFASLLAGALSLILVILIGLPIALVKIDTARREAQGSNRAMRQTLVNSYLERGMNGFSSDRSVEALPWLAAACEIENGADGSGRAARISRLRISGGLENTHRLIQVITSDAGPIRQAAFSPDGRWVATVHRGHSARVWDARSGRAVTPLLQGTLPSAAGSSDEPAYVHFHPTNSLLLASTGGDAPGLWDISDSNSPRKLKFNGVHRDLVRTAQFSSDGQQILSVSEDRSVAVWVTSTRNPAFPIRLFSPPGAPVVNASFSPSGAMFCVAGSFSLDVFDSRTGNKIRTIGGAEPNVQVAFHRDGTHLSVITQNGGWRVYSVDQKKTRSYVPVPSPQFLAVSPSGDRVAIASGKQCYVGTSNLNSRLDHDGYVEQMVFSPDGMLVATGTADRMVRIWRVMDGLPLGQPLAHLAGLVGLQFSPDGARLLTVTVDGMARIWQLRLPAVPVTPSVNVEERIQHVAFAPGGDQFALATQWGRYAVFETDSGRLLGERPETRPPPNAPRLLTTPSRLAKFSPDGRRLVVTDKLSLLSVFDLKSTQVVTQFQVFSASRRFERLFGKDFMDEVVNGIPSLDQLRYYTAKLTAMNLLQAGPAPSLNCADLSPDGRLLLAASDDGSARLFDTTTWEYVGGRATAGLMNVLLSGLDNSAGVRWLGSQGEFGHTNAILHAEFNHRGDRLVTASVDATAQIWITTNRQAATPPLRHRRPVLFAAFSPDDAILATASQDGQVRLWAADTGRELAIGPLRHDGAVTRLIFRTDGRRLISASNDGTARVWDCTTGQLMSVVPLGGRVIDMSLFPGGQLLFAAVADRHGRIWDIETGLPVSPPFGQHVTHAAASADGRFCLLVEGNSTTRVHRTSAYVSALPDPDLLLMKAKLYSGQRIEPTGRGVSTISTDEFMEVWKTASARWPSEFTELPNKSLAWHKYWRSAGEQAAEPFAVRFHTAQLRGQSATNVAPDPVSAPIR